MPRSKKYKLRARERRRPVNEESQTQRFDEAAAMEEHPSCSSVLEAPSQSVPPTESESIFQEFSGASATTTTSPGTFDTSSDDGEESQDEENSYSPEVLSAQISGSASPTLKVDVVEQFLLHKYRVNQPILREDIEKILGESEQIQYARILKEASERIEVVFAIELNEVDSTRHMYEFVSKLNLPNNGRMYAGRGWPKTGLLMNILGLIFMKGNCATEEDVWQFLNMLKLYAGKKHFIYGEPRKLINRDLVNLKYLEYRQVPGSDPPRHEYLWGPRAYAETNKMKVLEFMAKAGDTVPSTYSLQYEEALREKRAHTRHARRAGTRARARPESRAPSSSTQSAQ